MTKNPLLDQYKKDEKLFRVVSNAVLKLWSVVDDLAHLRPEQTRHYYVTIFGSARIQEGTPRYEAVKSLATALAHMGCRIVTGGGPGLMQAANEGASEARPGQPEVSVGMHIETLEQGINSYVGRVYQHKTFFSRLYHFVVRSNAFIVTTGGVGTLLELAMIWQLLQTRKLYDTPLILMGDMWREFIAWAKCHMVDHHAGLADAVDMQIPQIVSTVDEAVALIRDHHLQLREQAKAIFGEAM